MGIYTFSLGLGVVGLLAMALGGMARQAGLASGGPAHGHGGSHAHGHVHGHGPLHGHRHAPSHAHAPKLHGTAPAHSFLAAHLGWLLSPRVLFGILLGMGTAGLVLHPYLSHQSVGDGLVFSVALAVGVLFERLLLAPIEKLALRFASRPALTLETAVTGEATAVTAFDGNGQGIVQIDLDGQVVQVLATLTSRDRALGHRVRAGTTLRVEDVDPERNRCSVALY